MKLLKGFGLGILGFLLYVALSTFGLAFALNATLLNPNFVISEVGKLDVSAVAKDVIKSQISSQLGPQVAGVASPIIDSSINELKPWINDQVKIGVNSTYDYLLGKTPDLKITIQLEPAKQVIQKNMGQFGQLAQQYMSLVPSTFTVDKSMIGTDTMNTLAQVRQGISYFQTFYLWLIVLMVLLLIGIILIHHEVRGASRQLGTIALVCGAVDYASFFLANYFAGSQLPSIPGIPAQIQAWLPGFIADIMAPLQTFSIVLLAIGVVLIVVSFVYKPAKTEAPAKVD